MGESVCSVAGERLGSRLPSVRCSVACTSGGPWAGWGGRVVLLVPEVDRDRPVLRMVFRPVVQGAEHVPDEGPAILASNHLSYADWLFMPLTLQRRVTFVAKAEYFTTPGIKGWFQRKFFSGAGQVPIDRSGASAAEGALASPARSSSRGTSSASTPRAPAPTTAGSTGARPVSPALRWRPACP